VTGRVLWQHILGETRLVHRDRELRRSPLTTPVCDGIKSIPHNQSQAVARAISGRNAKTLEDAVKTIGNGILAVQSDVAKAADLDKLYATVSKKLGKIDVLFVNAGIYKFAPWCSSILPP
jgi:NAD(P)-dependent dehydrogenase (short-subunit alcohol dehydrogenase family)